MTRAVMCLTYLILVAYVAANTIRENSEVIVELPISLEVENNNLEANANPAIITLQGVGPTRQCAGVGQAVSKICFTLLIPTILGTCLIHLIFVLSSCENEMPI